jgi:cephalosporin hydroxylase
MRTAIRKHAILPLVRITSPISIHQGHNSLPRLINPAKEAGRTDGPSHDRNPLLDYFDANREGNGIHKWRHYFEIYHRHFYKFVGRPVNILEIGVFGGGSLRMWQYYFGPQCHVFGVDIEPECKAYETDRITVLIGDQSDRNFWKSFLKNAPPIDIVIDDGGHLPHQQIATIEELFPKLRAGGVYVCEDIHGDPNRFAQYISGLMQNLHAVKNYADNARDPEKSIVTDVSPFQSVVHSIHVYPFVVVLEIWEQPIENLVAAKRGTRWCGYVSKP